MNYFRHMLSSRVYRGYQLDQASHKLYLVYIMLQHPLRQQP